MSSSLLELEARYRGESCAESAFLLLARNVPDAITRAGVVRSEDRLLVSTGQKDTFEERFPAESLFFVDGVARVAFQGASMDCRACLGAAPGFELWLVPAIGGIGLDVPDVRALAEAAHAAGALLMVDITAPSGFGCRPLEAGADMSVERLCGVPGGEGGEVFALAIGRRVGRRRGAGSACAPVDAVHGAIERASASARALDVDAIEAAESALDAQPPEMQRRFDNARALAEYLSCHPGIPWTAYPGLKGHPCHDAAARSLRHGFGPVVDFQLPEHIPPAAFLARCDCAADKVADEARTRLTILDEEARYMRLIAGLNNPLDIADDLDQAHRWFRNPPEP